MEHLLTVDIAAVAGDDFVVQFRRTCNSLAFLSFMRPANSSASPAPGCVLVTHEYDPFRGGVATYVRELASAARGVGLPVEVWTVDYRGRRDVPVAAAITESPGSVSVVRLYNQMMVSILSAQRTAPQPCMKTLTGCC